MKKCFTLFLSLLFLVTMLPISFAEEEPTVITWIVPHDQANNDSYSTQKLPELLKQYGFNVKFEVITMGSHDANDWDNLLNTYIASGGAPADIVHMGSLKTNAVDAGWFVEITEEMIKENMPKYYQAALEIYEYMPAYFRDLRDGKVYCLVSWNMFGPCRHTMVYRKDWLDRMELEVPQTIEEFENYLRLCRYIKPRQRFIRYNKIRIGYQCTGYGCSLALSSRKLIRASSCHRYIKLNIRHHPHNLMSYQFRCLPAG